MRQLQAIKLVTCAVCFREMTADKLCAHVATAHLNYHSYRCADCGFACHHTNSEAIICHLRSTGHQARYKLCPNLESAVHLVVLESLRRSMHSATKMEEDENVIDIEVIDDDVGHESSGSESNLSDSSLDGFLTNEDDTMGEEDEAVLRGIIELLRRPTIARRELALPAPAETLPGPPRLADLPSPPPRRVVKLWSQLPRKPGRPPRTYRKVVDAKYRTYFEQAFDEWGDRYDGARINSP